MKNIFKSSKLKFSKAEIRIIIMQIYVDGSCVKKVGGYGYLYIQDGQIIKKEKGKVGDNTTNQVSELYAIYKALESKNSEFRKTESLENKNSDDNIDLYTDSKYAIGCCTEWWPNWIKNGWKNSKKQDVANKELIQKILKLLENKKVRFHHVFGHTGNIYNEMCDKLANEGRLM